MSQRSDWEITATQNLQIADAAMVRARKAERELDDLRARVARFLEAWDTLNITAVRDRVDALRAEVGVSAIATIPSAPEGR